MAYTVQTVVLHNIPIDFKESTQTVSKALRCYFAVGSCYFKLNTFFQQPIVFIIKKNYP
jgi:hypothetical protein